jgi:hypothetical protein
MRGQRMPRTRRPSSRAALRVIFALMGRYQDVAAATQLLSLLDTIRNDAPRSESLESLYLLLFWVGGLKRHLLIEASVEMGAISFVRMTIMRHLRAPADK